MSASEVDGEQVESNAMSEVGNEEQVDEQEQSVETDESGEISSETQPENGVSVPEGEYQETAESLNYLLIGRFLYRKSGTYDS